MRGIIHTASHPVRRSVAATLTVGLFLPSLAPGGTPEVPTFTDVVDVTVVNLEVVATDGGKRVDGLSAEDFELRIDGEPVAVDYFTEVREGLAVEAKPGSAVPPLVSAARVGTRYVVFIDDFFSVATHRDQALEALGEQLELLGAEDSMAIVAFDGRQIDLLSPWTQSKTDLGSALERAMGRNAYGLRRMSEMRRLGYESHGSGTHGAGGSHSLRSSFSSIGFLGAGRTARSPELQPGQELSTRISQVMRAAAATLRGFASPASGRQVMLLLSGCWPAFRVEWTERFADRRVGRGPLATGTGEGFRIFKPLVDTANRLGYTVYPVDLAPEGTVRATTAEANLIADGRDALFMVAEATGGQSIESPSARRALRRAVEDTRSFYWLGFTPQWRGDDESHRVEVESRRRGIRVKSRTEFTDLSWASRVDLMVEGAQLFGRPLAGEGELRVEPGEAKRAGRGRVRVPLVLSIPLDEITLLPGARGWSAALELRVAARDEDGLLADVPLVPVEIRRPDPPAAGDEEVFEIELKLRQRPHQLIVALYEPVSGDLLSKRLALDL